MSKTTNINVDDTTYELLAGIKQLIRRSDYLQDRGYEPTFTGAARFMVTQYIRYVPEPVRSRGRAEED